MTPETEQWKLNGDCKKCRRAEHCRKKCTANKRASDRALKTIANALINTTAPTQSIADHTKKWI